ncbi:MAG: hypothetical protein JO051_02360 [Acidobacteriaceae bacterium]|nr:hypothetical protein [Acidobacteriaceae bacterium]
MASHTRAYRPLATGDKRTWLADDHLLHIKTGIFGETYSRLYWADIGAAIFYRIEPPGTPLLIAEIFSLAVAALGSVLVSPLWGALTGALFAAVYAVWRFTRPHWAVQLFSKVSTARFPLSWSRQRSELLLDKLKARILSAQNSLGDALERPLLSLTRQDDQARTKRPRLILYGLLFAFGVVSGSTKATVALYCLLFLMIFFVPRDFDFPLSIRSAIVLNQLFALVRILAWCASFRYRFLFALGWQMQFSNELKLASAIFSLFGLLAVVVRSREPQRDLIMGSTLLGLGSQAE